MAKSDGWDLYFQVARRGFELTIGSATFCVLIDFTDVVGYILKQTTGLMYRPDFIQIPVSHSDIKLLVWAAFTVFFSYAVAWIKSRKYNVDRVRQLNMLQHVVRENPLESFITKATLSFVNDDEDSQVVCITLSSRKVYIGFCVGGNNVLHGNLEHVGMIPIRSGFRDKDDLSLVITNNYESYFLEQSVNIGEFIILIPTSEITSYQNFDLVAYEAIQQLEEPEVQPEAPSSPDEGVKEVA
ncbi:hypothetical protein NOL18_25055 [Vibrio parahaemolyticus]|uniref:hypothetical protein n=1 Tax=Vibrio parahaemolyticus TaxID=670 RepID=UPI00226A0FCF|nr:hypothetical protein [Vibrio parahaemolyticus]MCX8880379.1 hypothetical protein [Vibrio parahaemolyticus]